MLTRSGTVLACGRGDSGQLGLSVDPMGAIPVSSSSLIPRPIAPGRFAGLAIASIAAGAACSMAVTVDGGLYTWGFGDNHQTGSGSGKDSNIPFPLIPDAGTGSGAEGGAAASSSSSSSSSSKAGKAKHGGEMRGGRVVGCGMGGQHAVALATPIGHAAGDWAAAGIALSEEETAVVEDPLEGEEGSSDGDEGEGGINAWQADEPDQDQAMGQAKGDADADGEEEEDGEGEGEGEEPEQKGQEPAAKRARKGE